MGGRGVPELPWVSLVRCLVESARPRVFFCLQSGENCLQSTNTCLQREHPATCSSFDVLITRGCIRLFSSPSRGRFPFLIHVNVSFFLILPYCAGK